jgi:hypothetical protein
MATLFLVRKQLFAVISLKTYILLFATPCLETIIRRDPCCQQGAEIP